MNVKQRPGVGVHLYLLNGKGEILVGKRKGDKGGGTWGPPSGHLEYQEDPKDCAARETMEEAGIKIQDISFAGITNDIDPKESAHYINLHFVSFLKPGERARAMEPDKCEEWGWAGPERLRDLNLFLPTRNFMKQHKYAFTLPWIILFKLKAKSAALADKLASRSKE
jgi:8-oxo-dGTP diphosphatase